MLYDIFSSKTDKAIKIIDEYELSRNKMRYYGMSENDNLEKGLTLLERQTIDDLNELETDTFGRELLMSESIRFLMYLLTFEFKPNYDWVKYYKNLLAYFHSKDLLKWKYNLTIHKAYKQKRVILTITDNNMRLSYQSTQAVINDWGRYKADIILADRNVIGHVMSLQHVLELVL